MQEDRSHFGVRLQTAERPVCECKLPFTFTNQAKAVSAWIGHSCERRCGSHNGDLAVGICCAGTDRVRVFRVNSPNHEPRRASPWVNPPVWRWGRFHQTSARNARQFRCCQWQAFRGQDAAQPIRSAHICDMPLMSHVRQRRMPFTPLKACTVATNSGDAVCIVCRRPRTLRGAPYSGAAKWWRAIGSPAPVTATALADRGHCFALGAFRRLGAVAGEFPCVVDGAVFASFGVGGWRDDPIRF